MADSPARNGLVEKKGEGRTPHIIATRKGLELQPKILQAWKALYHRYSDLMGEEAGRG